MNGAEIDSAIKTLSIYADTREQDTVQSRHRLESIGLPIVRKKLDFGDYTAFCGIGEDKVVSLENIAVIERKMDLNELSGCLAQQRDRFSREFERASKAGAKVYLLIENGSIDMIMRHQYKTKFNSNAYLASLMAWLARYNCQIVFCSSINSGRLIKEIMLREMRKYLEEYDIEQEQ